MLLKVLHCSSLKDIFESDDNQKIISFIKDAHFHRAACNADAV